ncbi:MAG: hypothetical protein HOM34_01745 [Planctomycetes bacterium]|jgi:hypothetical protein|nr:hypothetical protein [Planctomycetota bacterium]MBT4029111.1 hypothetical protein [Planctomycetota bacterium]MBT4560489.1 hypothetical protein [Planctomycetota bacterium]MBT5102152.1 hypothetical protein [Planctomycetota bacterium]MBT5119425.1 hypothetical protein [Planctomycetota bacterium]
MKLSLPAFLIGLSALLLAAFLSSDLSSQAASSLSQASQEKTFAQAKDAHIFNVHRYGIGVVVHNPLKSKHFSRRIDVRDLGPNCTYLYEDLEPTKATVRVNDNYILALHPDGRGGLTGDVPHSVLGALQTNEVLIDVYHQSRLLFTHSFTATFF